jgi:hypothetical protein
LYLGPLLIVSAIFQLISASAALDYLNVQTS